MMKLKLLKPSGSLNKAYRKTSVTRQQIETFKKAYRRLSERVNLTEHEENQKNVLSYF